MQAAVVREVREVRLGGAGRAHAARLVCVARLARLALAAAQAPLVLQATGLELLDHGAHRAPQGHRERQDRRDRPGLPAPLDLQGRAVEGDRPVSRRRIADMSRLERWVTDHPKTSAYLIIVVTLNFLLNLVDVVLR